MAHYSQERKETVMRRMLSGEQGITKLSKETGISDATLYRWRDKAKLEEIPDRNLKKESVKYSSEQKFAQVVATMPLNEAELGEYCRKQGLYPDQIKAWRKSCEAANAGSLEINQALRHAKIADQRRIKELERELLRKERALAETAALLTLRKKAAAIWGEDEDA